MYTQLGEYWILAASMSSVSLREGAHKSGGWCDFKVPRGGRERDCLKDSLKGRRQKTHEKTEEFITMSLPTLSSPGGKDVHQITAGMKTFASEQEQVLLNSLET